VSVFWFIVGLLVAWRLISWVRRARGDGWEQALGARSSRCRRRRPRRHRRLGDARRRRMAREQARDLVAVLASGGHDPLVHLAAGVVLEPGEVAWQRTTARLAVWRTESTWVTHSRVSWWGRRAHSVGREATTSGWREHGSIDWLITSARLVGRAPGSGELISIWWAGLSGVQVDLGLGVVKLEATNGWRAQVAGPGVAPIAVAAVAACHGLADLAKHPALVCLRDHARGPGMSQGPEPSAVSPGAPVLRLWSSGQSE
jgi:hypothetical protein